MQNVVVESMALGLVLWTLQVEVFWLWKIGHISQNCPTRPEQSGKGKGGEKGKQGLVKSDMWNKKGSKAGKGFLKVAKVEKERKVS